MFTKGMLIAYDFLFSDAKLFWRSTFEWNALRDIQPN
jgi:hypothetical protein